MSQGFLGIVLVLAATVAAYWPTMQSLLRFWNDYSNLSYTHGYLVAAICAWLLWRARHRLAAAAGRFSPLGLAVLLAGSLVWAIAWLAGIEVGHQLMLPVLMLSATAAYAGVPAARVALLPVAYLYFAIPVWDLINGGLQQLTVAAVTTALKLFAVPAWFDGNSVHLGSGTFEIAGGCSGLHFFVVALAIAVLFGELGNDTLATRIKLVLIAAGMAIVMNWIRVTTIIVAGYLTQMQSFLVKVDHYYFGWALFGVLLGIFYWGVPRWLDLKANPPRAVVPVAARKAGASAAALILTLAALGVVPVLTATAQSRASLAPPEFSSLAPAVPGWSGPLSADEEWQPSFPAADARQHAAYERDGERVQFFTAHYARQTQGKELVGYGNSVLGDPDRWRARDDLATGEGRPELAQVAASDSSGTAWVVAYYYEVGGRTFTDGLASKLYYPIALLRGAPSSRVVAVAARCDRDCASAARTVAEFMDSNQWKNDR